MMTETSTLPAAAPASEHPALARLAQLDREWTEAVDEPSPPLAIETRPATVRTGRPAMGYQPGLDGLRAVSVVAVMLYHAGFGWMHGGFFGVEVFFVVSGFLITSLLIEERSGSGRVSLSQFWLRRARRLLPALGVVLLAVAAWAAVLGSAEQQSQLRRDFPWSIFYVSNWGQILGDVPYYSGDPPLLRHLWSLAVEEQWYLLWPLAFVALAAWQRPPAGKAALLLGAALGSMLLTFWLHAGGPGPVRSPISALDGIDRVNFMYLSTPTRASGLLLGAAAAFVWRPWRMTTGTGVPRARPGLDATGGIAVGGLLCVFAVASITDGYVYQWLLPLVSVLSAVTVMVVVHPWAAGMRRVFGWRPLVEIGKRSYGLYLWHWPIFVIADATRGDVARVIPAGVVTVVIAELCYRYVETPVRRGALGRWWRGAGDRRSRPLAAAAVAVAALVAFYTSVDPFDRAAGGEDASFTLAPERPAANADPRPPAPASTDPAADDPDVAPLDAGEAPATAPSAGPSAPTLPRAVAVVGDSQAHSLAVNTPAGLESTLTVVDGSVDGCSVYDNGGVQSARAGFDNSFGICADWQQQWAGAAAQADIALVVLGAWDVFDLETATGTLAFGTPEWDEYFVSNLRSGLDAMRGTGAQVALLEVACMRPQDIEGAGVPALPERGDDARVTHLNELLRGLAGDGVTFVEGPDDWCGDEAVATDLAMRWDGVHVYRPGAELIFETIAPALVELPA